MEKNRVKILKERLLLAFVGTGVLLVLLVWGSNLMQREQVEPDYYRDTFNYDLESIWLTETAIVEEYIQTQGVSPTPEPTRAHQGGGGGDHDEPTETTTPAP